MTSNDRTFRTLNILCGLSSEESGDIRTEIVKTAETKGVSVICISRYRKLGISQFLDEHPDLEHVILQESMQSDPYRAEEIAELMEERNLNIIIILNKAHSGNEYMKILYTAGILNALYEEDATAKNIIDLIIKPRTRKECRRYYKIITQVDAMQALEIIEDQKLESYIDYLDAAGSKIEQLKRYHYIVKQLTLVQNIVFVENLPKHLHFKDDPEFLFFSKYKKGSFIERWKKILYPRRIVKKNQDRTNQIPECNDEIGKKVYSDQHVIEEDISDLVGNVCDNNLFERDACTNKNNMTLKRKGFHFENILSKKVLFVCGFVVIGCLLVLTIFSVYSAKVKKSVDNLHMQMKETGALLEKENELDKYTLNTGKLVADFRNESEEVEQSESFIVRETQIESSKSNSAKKQETMQTETSTQNNTQKESQKETPKETQKEVVSQTATDSTKNNHEVTYETEDKDEIGRNTQPTTKEESEIGSKKETVPQTEKETSLSFSGEIYSGDEVLSIAKKESAAGMKIYVTTRSKGEGYFTVSELGKVIDSSCSYVASKQKNQITFTEQ